MTVKIREFSATAQILGAEQLVRYEGGALTIEGLSVEQAYHLLDRVAFAVERGQDAAPATTAVAAAEPEPPTAVAAASAKKKKPKPTVLAVVPSQKPPTPAPTIEVVVPEATGAPEVEDDEFGEPEPAPVAAKEGETGIPDEVLKTDKLRDVLVWAYDSGAHTVADIVAKCVAATPHIPMLARVSNLEDRVKRAVTVLGLEVTA